MAEKKAATVKEITFKGKPLARSGAVFYYGLPSDRFVVKMESSATETYKGEEVPTKFSVELLDMEDTSKPKLTMKTERNTMYDALDIAWVWLERAQAETAGV